MSQASTIWPSLGQYRFQIYCHHYASCIVANHDSTARRYLTPREMFQLSQKYATAHRIIFPSIIPPLKLFQTQNISILFKDYIPLTWKGLVYIFYLNHSPIHRSSSPPRCFEYFLVRRRIRVATVWDPPKLEFLDFIQPLLKISYGELCISAGRGVWNPAYEPN